MSIEKLATRLQDPLGILKDDSAKLVSLQKKLSVAMTILATQPANGGHPFLFALTAPKMHSLRANLGSRKFRTAATNGKEFFWHPDFLDKLNDLQISTVMMHEGYHVLFYHVPRGDGHNPEVWNWAIDYIVNAVIEVDHEQQGRKGKLWGGALGDPITLAGLLDWIDGKTDFPEGTIIFADKSVHGRSPESIYEEIMSHMEKSPRKCPSCGALGNFKGKGKKGKDDKKSQGKKSQESNKGDQQDGSQDGDHKCDSCGDGDGEGSCPTCGGGLMPMDEHIRPEVSKDEAVQEALRASDAAKQMRGTTPAGISELLKELQKPTLSWQDIVRHAFQRKIIDVGNKNDWKRFRRRPLSYQTPLYIPKKFDHKPRWVAMLDTSGSMSDNDMTYCISQLQVLGSDTDGLIIPCDAQVYWDDATSIKKASDLKMTKATGRGGTEFRQFFEEFPSRIGVDFDVIIIMTDGYFGSIPAELAPRCDVVWVISNDNMPSVPFGRVAPLRSNQK